MTKIISIHPENPQERLIKQIVEQINDGALIIYPSDSGYCFGCKLENKKTKDKITTIRELDADHYFTITCHNLSQLSVYAQVNNVIYRQIKNAEPGAYTFILKATKEVPKRLLHSKRKTIALRIAKNQITTELLRNLNEPLMTSSLLLPDKNFFGTDPVEINDKIGTQVDIIIDAGTLPILPTTIIDLSKDSPEILRKGQGDVSIFLPK